MINMNEIKQERKQQAKDKIVKIKSQAQTVDQLVWRRDTGNSVIDNFIIEEAEVGGYIVLDGVELKVRMPLRKHVKRFEHLSNKYNQSTGELNISQREAIELAEVQEKIMFDMIPEFDDESEEYRVDATLYNEIATFCWEFYRFFGQRSTKAQSELFGSKTD